MIIPNNDNTVNISFKIENVIFDGENMILRGNNGKAPTSTTIKLSENQKKEVQKLVNRIINCNDQNQSDVHESRNTSNKNNNQLSKINKEQRTILLEAKNKKGYTWSELAGKIGCKNTDLHNILSGRTIGNLDLRFKLSQELNVSLDSITK